MEKTDIESIPIKKTFDLKDEKMLMMQLRKWSKLDSIKKKKDSRY